MRHTWNSDIGWNAGDRTGISNKVTKNTAKVSSS